MKSLLTSVASSVSARFASAANAPKACTSAPSFMGRLRQAAFGVVLLGSSIFATPAVAQQQPVTVQKIDPLTLRVRTQNPTNQLGQLQVFDLGTGQKLYDETYRDTNYTCQMSFQGLKPGSYSIHMKLGQDRYRYFLRVTPNPSGSNVSVYTMKARLSKQSQQLATLNTLAPLAVSPAVATK
jgi:hypothetical protein